jgi:hypothetical protein
MPFYEYPFICDKCWTVSWHSTQAIWRTNDQAKCTECGCRSLRPFSKASRRAVDRIRSRNDSVQSMISVMSCHSIDGDQPYDRHNPEKRPISEMTLPHIPGYVTFGKTLRRDLLKITVSEPCTFFITRRPKSEDKELRFCAPPTVRVETLVLAKQFTKEPTV